MVVGAVRCSLGGSEQKTKEETYFFKRPNLVIQAAEMGGDRLVACCLPALWAVSTLAGVGRVAGNPDVDDVTPFDI